MFNLAKKLVSSIESQATTYLANSPESDHDSSTYALRVLNIEKHSLADKYGFESFFDYITAINHRPITTFFQQGSSVTSNPYSSTDQSSINFSILLDFLNSQVNELKNDLIFTTWSAKGAISRDVLIPNSEFASKSQLDEVDLGGTNTSTTIKNTTFQKINFTLQLTPLETASYVWHVLRVQPNSPAHLAGILPDDYIINCEGGKLSTGGEDLLGKVVSSVYSKWRLKREQSTHDIPPCSLVLYVYNHDYDTVRPVTIFPNGNWGGRGFLGCDIGYGLLHQIPEVVFGKSAKQGNERRGSPVDISPGAVMFSQEKEEVHSSIPLLPPATSNFLKLSAKAPSFSRSQEHLEGSDVAARKPPPSRRARRGSSKNIRTEALEEYFREETERSKEGDSSRDGGEGDESDVPPPPRVSKGTDGAKEEGHDQAIDESTVKPTDQPAEQPTGQPSDQPEAQPQEKDDQA
ncbi:DEKNAAC103974 [Brettanomyces naardenensis]|uniref:DEKNAAC103974 n=1 Tax=Brettanomyces naardenensis TaxID=13370 RepID=A0A448YPN5_BRENA|nr:DEKNAAC103974 [Brettanomyces naardenensis]